MEKITEKKKYFVVRERAVPEVLLRWYRQSACLIQAERRQYRMQQNRPESVEAPFINIRMIFFLFTKRQEERPLPSLFRWMMNQDFICSTSDHCTFSWKYSYDSSEYSNQWDRNSHTQCRYSSGRGRCRGHG